MDIVLLMPFLYGLPLQKILCLKSYIHVCILGTWVQ